jgi:HK97 family phage major capsid protein
MSTPEQRKDMSILLAEYGPLSNKTTKFTAAESQRALYLQNAISAVKAGASLAEFEQEAHNERARAAGLPTTAFKKSLLPRGTEDEIRGWQQAVLEKRDMGEGAPMLAQFGTYTSLGYFVPNDFFQNLVTAMKAHDVLFDDESATVIRSSNGRPLPVPIAGDIENVASVIGEGGSQTSVDIDTTGHAVLGAYSYSTPRLVVSLEAFQDLEASFTAVGLFKRFAADRLARGIAADMLNGSGSSKTLGLIPSLEALGLIPVTAAGSSANTGGSETGATSLGSNDFTAALAELDSAYLASPKCAWLMNKTTLANTAGLVTKFGQPLNLVSYATGYPTIYGIPIKVCPSMPNVGASTTPVILGDLSYWATRLIIDDQFGVAVYREAPGLIEQGNVGLRCFARADGALLYKDTNSPAPFVMIQCNS